MKMNFLLHKKRNNQNACPHYTHLQVPQKLTLKPKLAKECNQTSTNTNFEKKLIYA